MTHTSLPCSWPLCPEAGLLLGLLWAPFQPPPTPGRQALPSLSCLSHRLSQASGVSFAPLRRTPTALFHSDTLFSPRPPQVFVHPWCPLGPVEDSSAPPAPLPGASILPRYQRQRTWACLDSSLFFGILPTNIPLPHPFGFQTCPKAIPSPLPSVLCSQDHTAALRSFSSLGSPHKRLQNNYLKTTLYNDVQAV